MPDLEVNWCIALSVVLTDLLQLTKTTYNLGETGLECFPVHVGARVSVAAPPTYPARYLPIYLSIYVGARVSVAAPPTYPARYLSIYLGPRF